MGELSNTLHIYFLIFSRKCIVEIKYKLIYYYESYNNYHKSYNSSILSINLSIPKFNSVRKKLVFYANDVIF